MYGYWQIEIETEIEGMGKKVRDNEEWGMRNQEWWCAASKV
jgi:hypothetical protein